MSYTLKNLKEFLATLTDEQLEQTFILTDEEGYPYFPDGPEIIKDDIYINDSDEDDMGTIEELNQIHGAIDITDYSLSNLKGTIHFPF